jgi:hypothetical protein
VLLILFSEYNSVHNFILRVRNFIVSVHNFILDEQQQLVLQFFVHKDLLGKIRVHDFIVVVRDFIVGFATLLFTDNNICTRQIKFYTH